MIFTITLNPCIDYYIKVEDHLMKDEVNRGTQEQYKAAGKGLNVSRALSALGIPSTAVAVLGGFTGKFIEQAFDEDPLIHLMTVPVRGCNRINMKAWTAHGSSLCINGEGPTADEATISIAMSQLRRLMPHDCVLISGSVMKGMDDSLLADIAARVHEMKAELIIDMEQLSEPLIRACRPSLIKPNIYEYGKLIGRSDLTIESLADEIGKGLAMGTECLLVSCGKDGAMLGTREGIYRMDQPHDVLVNKAGAGDAMLAAFVGMKDKGLSDPECLQWAGAAGNAAASTFDPISMDLVSSYYPRIKVEKIR